MFHDYMRPMFDYVNANKDNKDCKLHMEQFGELHESQKFDDTYQQIDNTWRECAEKLKFQISRRGAPAKCATQPTQPPPGIELPPPNTPSN